MSDLNLNIDESLSVSNETVQTQQVNGHDVSHMDPGVDHGEPQAIQAPPPQPSAIDFVLSQLPLPEQMGFLRGSIMLCSARLGTANQQPTDADYLDQFNYLFQIRLREMVQQQQEAAAKQGADYENMVRQSNEDAVKRGFKDANDMGAKLKELYASIEERVMAWHTSTEPGGDEALCPDKDALLYDVYMMIAGQAR